MSREGAYESAQRDLLNLKRAGAFLIADEGNIYPPRIMSWDGKLWFRFMDRIYCPQPFDMLTPALVCELCELRLQLIDRVLDYNLYDHLTHCLLATAQAHARNARVILDFGTGNGQLRPRIDEIFIDRRIVGCDMSIESLLRGDIRGSMLQVAAEGPIPFCDESFDLILAGFVFHFGVPQSMIRELARVCKTEGVMVGTIYGPAQSRLPLTLRNGGFVLQSRISSSQYAKHSVFTAKPAAAIRRRM